MKPIPDASSHEGQQPHARRVVHSFYAENDEFQQLITERVRPHVNRARNLPDNLLNPELARKLAQDGKDLARINMHYRRKEELLFPCLKKHGEKELPDSMWEDDDQVRQYLALAVSLIAGAVDRPSGSNLESAADQLDLAASEAQHIILRENDELLPLALQKLTDAEWGQIEVDSADYGLAPQKGTAIWVSPIDRAEAAVRRAFRDGMPQAAQQKPRQASQVLDPEKNLTSLASTNPNRPAPCLASGPGIGRHDKSTAAAKVPDAAGDPDSPSDTAQQQIRLSTGSFNSAQLEAVLEALPLDLTFVDADDTVRYFSHAKSRMIPRATSSLGLSVTAGYPAEYQSTVRKVLEEFRAGERNDYELRMHDGGRPQIVRFVALRSAEGSYLGALETTKDLGPLERIGNTDAGTRSARN